MEVVKENPLPFVLGAFALGLVVGLSIPGREPTAREKYLEEPLDDIRRMLGKLSNTLQHQTSSALHGAESRASGLFDSVKSAMGRFW